MARRAPHELKPEQKIAAVVRTFRDCYGQPRRQGRDALEVLIGGVLSQNTTDLNSARAYERLMQSFGSWEGVAGADGRAVEEAIQHGGLAARKAATIQSILRWVGERGGYSLEFLRHRPPEQAEKELRAIKGVGVKTARLALLFGFGMPVFVVDTHVLRVAKRLGLIPQGCTREKAHRLLDDLVPDSQKYPVHMNMIRHGRQVCRPRNPSCDRCPVRRWCVFAPERK